MSEGPMTSASFCDSSKWDLGVARMGLPLVRCHLCRKTGGIAKAHGKQEALGTREYMRDCDSQAT